MKRKDLPNNAKFLMINYNETCMYARQQYFRHIDDFNPHYSLKYPSLKYY